MAVRLDGKNALISSAEFSRLQLSGKEFALLCISLGVVMTVPINAK